MKIVVHRDAPREAHLAAERYRIKQRINASIKPQLDKCDRLLDYYTEGLPREAWRPIARDLGAPLDADEFVEEWRALMTGVRYAMHDIGTVIEHLGKTIADTFELINLASRYRPTV